MRHCPNCQYEQAWELADGRFKCQVCGTRYSWTSVWDSVRLSATTKERLIESFADGIPVYRQRFETDACLCSQERFYRVLRACCAYHEYLREPLGQPLDCEPAYAGRRRLRGWGSARQVTLVSMHLDPTNNVKIHAIPETAAAETVRLLREHCALGNTYRIEDRIALAGLKVQGDYVVMRTGVGTTSAPVLHPLDAFWRYLEQRLRPLRKIPRRFLHLYLGEVCFRFNHREYDFGARLRDLLHRLTINEIKIILVREQKELPIFSPAPAHEILERQSERRMVASSIGQE